MFPHSFLLLYICILLFISFFQGGDGYSFARELPAGCDEEAALQCEYDFLICKLFNGPANDAKTLCDCAKQFYGSCIRQAGVSFQFSQI